MTGTTTASALADLRFERSALGVDNPIPGSTASAGSGWDPVTTHTFGGRAQPVLDDPADDRFGFDGAAAPAPGGPPEWDTSIGTGPRQSRAAARRRQRPAEWGLPGWAALLILLCIAGVGGIIDTAGGSSVRGGFNISLVVAALVGIIVVRHRDMFTIVVAPPLVYLIASGLMLWVRGGLHNRKVLFDAASNWLVYGFPAIAGATAAVLIVAGIRLITRR